MLIYNWLRHVKWRTKGGRPPLPISNQNTRLTAGWSNNSSQISFSQLYNPKQKILCILQLSLPMLGQETWSFQRYWNRFQRKYKHISERKNTVQRNQREAVRKIIHSFDFVRSFVYPSCAVAQWVEQLPTTQVTGDQILERIHIDSIFVLYISPLYIISRPGTHRPMLTNCVVHTTTAFCHLIKCFLKKSCKSLFYCLVFIEYKKVGISS